MKLSSYDRKAIPVDRSRINEVRDGIEQSPLEVNGLFVDVDEKSDKRMAESISLASSMGVTSFHWTLADNTQATLTVEQLADLYDAMRVVRAVRAQQVHQDALLFKMNGATERDMLNWVASYADVTG